MSTKTVRFSLSPQEEWALATRWREESDVKALQKLMASGMDLVPCVVFGEFSKFLFHQNRDDLLGAGFVGLAEASSRFDPAKRVRLSTFAPYWIRKMVWNEIHLSKSLVHRKLSHNFTVSYYDFISAITKARRKAVFGEINLAKLAKELEITVPQLIQLIDFWECESDVYMGKYRPERFYEIFNLAGEGEDQEGSFSRQEDDEEKSGILQCALHEVLTDHERGIVAELCKPLNGKKNKNSTNEIARRFGVSGQAVRLSKSRAMAKLESFAASNAEVLGVNAG